MSCVLSKEKVKINNMLPKNHEIASTSGEITLRKDRFDILCFEINCDKFSSCKKKKIQIVCCSCTQRKLREESVPFYSSYKTTKCFRSYRRSTKSISKYYLRFIC